MATPTSSGSVSSLFTSDLSGITHTDSLIAGSKWGGAVGSGAALTYSFGESGKSVYSQSNWSGYGSSNGNGEPWNGFSSFSATQKAAATKALNAFSEVANVSFNLVTDSNTVAGDIRFAETSQASTAWAYYPSATAVAGDIWFSHNNIYNTSQDGTYGYMTYMHEVGHAMGLKHAHDTSGGGALPSSLDSTHNTVMSYRSYIGDAGNGYTQHFYPTSLMLYDIAAIQHLYGVNSSTRSGDTTYSWNTGEQILETIWDGGGNDTIDWSNQTSNAKINLEDGSWSKLGPSYYNGQSYETDTLAIAFGAVIENAEGGSGNDTITGNSAANELFGNGGKDNLQGYSGRDYLTGGNGSDTLRGGTGSDTLEGGAGRDYINGGGGSDSISGQSGNDFLKGSYGRDNLSGGIGSDTLRGNSGKDLLEGGSDKDLLIGGSNSDTLLGDSGRDKLIGSSGNDHLEGGGGSDHLKGGSGRDHLKGNSGHDKLNGGSGSDTLWGNSGDDSLKGASGNDILNGQDGDDLFLFTNSNGKDIINDFQAGSGSDDQMSFSLNSHVNSISDLTITQQNNDTLLEFGESNSVLLIGVNQSDLHSDDFLF